MEDWKQCFAKAKFETFQDRKFSSQSTSTPVHQGLYFIKLLLPLLIHAHPIHSE